MIFLLTMQIIFGDRITVFEVRQADAGKYLLSVKDTHGKDRHRDLKKEDFDKLKQLVARMNEPNGSLTSCPRAHVVIKTGSTLKQSCLGVTKGLEAKVNHFHRVLRLMI